MPDARLLLPDGREWTPTEKGIAFEGAGSVLSGDATVAQVVGSDQHSSISDLEVYWMLATKHPYVRSCISLISNAIASDGFDIAPGDSEDARPLSVTDDPRVRDIREFFSYASAVTSDRARRAIIASDIETFGFAVLRKIRATGGGGLRMIAGLERVDPRTISARVNARATKILKYIIRKRSSDGLYELNRAPDEVNPNDIIFFSVSGGDALAGFSAPLEALDLSLATDFAQRRFRQAFCDSGAKAGLILTSDTYDEDAFKAAREEIKKNRTGAGNAYKTMLLPGGWKVANVPTAGQDDADFVKAAGLNREDVAAVFAVPVGMISYSGSALGSAGKGDDRDFFEQFACLPLEEIIYERLTMGLLRDEFGITDLHIVPKRRNRIRFERFDAAMKAVKFGATGNEARRIVNLPPITDDRYDMDAPLFIGASKDGVIADEPLHVDDSTGLDDQVGSGDAQGAASAAKVATKETVS